MRLLVPLAFVCLPVGLGGGLAATACGGPSFSTAPFDAGGTTPITDGAHEAGGSFCAIEAGTHTFCDDFDGPPLTLWNSIDQSNGTASVDATLSVSPPNSFKSLVDVSSLAAANRGRLVKLFSAASRVVVAFEMQIDQVGPKPVTGGNAFVTVGLGSSYTIGIDANTDALSYFENQIPDAGGLSVSVSDKTLLPTQGILGTWASVVFDVNVGQATLSVTINGIKLLSGWKITPPSGLGVSVYFGVQARNVSTKVGAHYDNVTIDLTL